MTNKEEIIAHYYFEEWQDGYHSCTVREEFEHFVLMGYGNTEDDAYNDMRDFYEEVKKIALKEGWECPNLTFVEDTNKE